MLHGFFLLHCWFFTFMASDPKCAITHLKRRALNLKEFPWMMSWPKGRVPNSSPAALRRSDSKRLPKALHFYLLGSELWWLSPHGLSVPGLLSAGGEAFASFGQGFCQSGCSCHRDADHTPLTHPTFLFAAAKSISACWIEWSWGESLRFEVDALREADFEERHLWGSDVFIWYGCPPKLHLQNLTQYTIS